MEAPFYQENDVRTIGGQGILGEIFAVLSKFSSILRIALLSGALAARSATRSALTDAALGFTKPPDHRAKGQNRAAIRNANVIATRGSWLFSQFLS